MIINNIVYRDFTGKYVFFPLSRAEGSLLWDKDDKRYIDFTSAWNVTNLGWNNPEVNEALIRQAQQNVQGMIWGADYIQEKYAEALTSALPKGLDACVRATGGTESVEAAIKIARTYTNRKKIIGFRNSYHGQLFASLALGNTEEVYEALAPLVPDITPMEYPHEGLGENGFEKFTTELEMLLKNEDVAAVVAEPGIVTGWGSTLVAYPGFLKKIRELTQKYGTLLIVDEVGTGFSRTGTLFGIKHENVVPDMVVFAKGITNGAAAMGAVVGRSELFESASIHAVLISTFGWTPVACAAALKSLEIHQRDHVWEEATKKGAYIQQKLKAHIGAVVTGVGGKGMEISIQFQEPAICQKVQKSALSSGLHVVIGKGNNMQIMPPLTISQELLDEGLDILIKSFT